MNLKEKHEKLLYPVVRVFGKKGTGSGTIIYCNEDPKNNGEYLTFVLTNHHVIDDNIAYKKEWDSVLKRKREQEIIDKAKVEVFSYVRLSECDSSNRYNADIVAYDKQHDLALLKMETPRAFKTVAPLLPKDKIKDLKLFTEIAVSGCSMAHEPFINFGQLTYLNEIIDQKKYFMVNAGSYFGNSGGALFLAETGEMIGVPSRLTGIQLGFGIDMITFMGFSCHTERLYEFFEEQECQFIFDSSDTYYNAVERRKKKQDKVTMSLRVRELNSDEKDDGDNDD